MRSYSHLSEDERDQIGVLRAAGRSMGAIARALGRAKATISRELRNEVPWRASALILGAGHRKFCASHGGESQERPPNVCSWGTGSPRDGTPRKISGWLSGNEPRLPPSSAISLLFPTGPLSPFSPTNPPPPHLPYTLHSPPLAAAAAWAPFGRPFFGGPSPSQTPPSVCVPALLSGPSLQRTAFPDGSRPWRLWSLLPLTPRLHATRSLFPPFPLPKTSIPHPTPPPMPRFRHSTFSLRSPFSSPPHRGRCSDCALATSR